MKIAIVVDRYYPVGGGIEQFVRGFALAARAAGDDITIITRTLPDELDREDWSEGRIVRIDALGKASPEPWTALERWREVADVLAQDRPDVVFANNHGSLAAITAARHLGLPVVYYMHGWGMFCSLKLRLFRPDGSVCRNQRSLANCLDCSLMNAPVRRPFPLSLAAKARRAVSVAKLVRRYDGFQAILEQADARIVSSPAWQGFFRAAPTHAIPLGIDPAAYRPDPDAAATFRAKHGITGEYVLVPGRIHEIKGQHVAAAALAKLPADLTMVFAGNTMLATGTQHEENVHRARVRDVLQRDGTVDRTVFTGYLDQADMVAAYSGALATVVPSVWQESFGYVAIEAMACGSPPIVTATCGAASVIEHGIDGLIVPPGDADALVSAVTDVTARRERFAEAARRKAETELAWEAVAPRIRSVLQAVA